MVATLRYADRTFVSNLLRNCRVSDHMLCSWRKWFQQLQPAVVKRPCALETENAKLKPMLAEREVAIDAPKELNQRKC